MACWCRSRTVGVHSDENQMRVREWVCVVVCVCVCVCVVECVHTRVCVYPMSSCSQSEFHRLGTMGSRSLTCSSGLSHSWWSRCVFFASGHLFISCSSSSLIACIKPCIRFWVMSATHLHTSALILFLAWLCCSASKICCGKYDGYFYSDF